MDRRTFVKTLPAMTALTGTAPFSGQASDNTIAGLQTITLPTPKRDGGTSVLAALQERRTNRNIGPQKVSPQVLSNLLWAAFGVNRENGPFGQVGRTAASASNSQEIDIYVALAEGIYLYEAVPHRLSPVVVGDHRAIAGGRSRRGRAAQAPVNLIYVADFAKYGQARLQEPGLRDPATQKSYSSVAVGLIAGNVYLFAASQGLAAWFHNCNRTALAAELKLRPEQYVLCAQTVGHPVES